MRRRTSSIRLRLHSPAISLRRGFSLLELLVVISIIGVLTALLVPAVLSARAAARRTQCQNNLRNLAVAMFAETQASRRYPAAGNFSASGPEQYHNWVVTLLPWIDQKALWREWNFDEPHNSDANRAVAKITPPVLVCPEDITALPGESNLSYVVNGGFGWTEPVDCPTAKHMANPLTEVTVSLDLNGNGVVCPDNHTPAADDGRPGDRDLLYRTGLFFVENWPPGTGTLRHHTLDTVRDGMSNSLMLAENVRAGYDPYFPDVSGWPSPEAWRACFFVSSYVCEDATCSEGNVDYHRANDRSQQPYRLEAINASLLQAEGQAPWPSSFHPGGVHVAFADGRVKFLSESIDGAVYAALASPQGSLISGPLRQQVVGSEW